MKVCLSSGLWQGKRVQGGKNVHGSGKVGWDQNVNDIK